MVVETSSDDILLNYVGCIYLYKIDSLESPVGSLMTKIFLEHPRLELHT